MGQRIPPRIPPPRRVPLSAAAPSDDRSHRQRDRGPVVVGTGAVGMGIDKPDVRLVLHWGPPPTLEAYYQEAGRAGRDGRRAACVMLWRPEDLAWGNCSPQVRRYVEARTCRRRMLLAYFGERAARCSGCDRCGMN